MICDICHGTRVVDDFPCLHCLGGQVDCCDGAPPADTADPHGYSNPAFAARKCDHCGAWYRGPAVYCSLECALADA